MWHLAAQISFSVNAYSGYGYVHLRKFFVNGLCAQSTYQLLLALLQEQRRLFPLRTIIWTENASPSSGSGASADTQLQSHIVNKVLYLRKGLSYCLTADIICQGGCTTAQATTAVGLYLTFATIRLVTPM